MTSGLRAVLDVNVLVSAARTPNGFCGRLLEAAIDGRWQSVLSMMLFEELEDVLARPAFTDRIGQEAIDRFLAGLLAIAEWAEDPQGPGHVLTRDPDDDYLLALAHSAQVDVEDVRIVVELRRRSSRVDGQTVTGSAIS